MNQKDIARLVGVTRRTVYKWMKDGLLPRPIKSISVGKKKYWLTDDIIEFIGKKREQDKP